MGHVVLITGESKAGKSTSLRNLTDVLYANCEAGKQLPFRGAAFKPVTIKDPRQMTQFFKKLETDDNFKLGVVDGLNYLMDMYESLYVLTAEDTRSAWGGYAEYLRNMMQQDIAALTKPLVITGHSRVTYNEALMFMENKMPIKGALQNTGVESFFTTVLGAKKVTLDELEGYENDLLVITPRDLKLGYKHVFQTQPTAETTISRISSPMEMFSDAETYIDNDVALVLKRMDEYYA